MSDSTLFTPGAAAVDVVLAYHRRTKHRFEAYAAGPAALDWDAQPAPFRHFDGAPATLLPLAAELGPEPPAAVSLARLGALFRLSLAITAWKSYGPDRWALRANPSSGNLHPVEAYLIVGGVAGLADGLYHYRPDDHALECRARLAVPTPPLLLVGLSSVMWREAWKYGERAFRYCQLDVGHAVAALAYAAATLGWSVAEQRHIGTATLARLLGVDREADFPPRRRADTEREEAEILLAVGAAGGTSAACDARTLSALFAGAEWHGSASAIDERPVFRWPVIDEVAAATRLGDGAVAVRHAGATPPRPPAAAGRPLLMETILGRRSAQRFDPRGSLAAADFFALLEALMPGPGAPWPALAEPPRISLVLFVHRVVGLEPGLYLLPRRIDHATRLPAAMQAPFAPAPVAAAPAGLPLQYLAAVEPQELRRAARAIHCHQDIAANACFALGMLAEFAAPVAADPAAYRDLHREAGLIGQVLYLEAEALGLRGTGIGCFFDDPFHGLLGLADEQFQTVYHFTVGMPVDDARLETAAAYPNR